MDGRANGPAMTISTCAAMLLAIDAGNTNIVFAVLEGEVICAQWRAATRADRTADEYIVWLRELMSLEGLKSDEINGAIIATVVPQALFSLQTLCRKHFKSEPLVVGAPNVELGLQIRIKEPRQAGADRIVNAVAAHKAFPGHLIVIDFGTATTFDVVSEDGGYEGGVIAPGINLSAEALHMATAQLPRIAVERPQGVIGWDTIFEPSRSRVISPVSRLWSVGWGGYVLFDWDTFFAVSLAAIGSRDLAYANALEMLREATADGVVPNYARAGGSERSKLFQPPARA